MSSTIPAPLLSEGSNQFDGSAESAVIIPHDSSYVIDQGTFEVAFTADSVSGRRTLFSKDSSGFDTGGHITAYVENGDLVVRLQSTSQTHVLFADNVIAAGVPYRAAVTFGPEGLKLYLDGVLVDEDAYTGGLQVNEEPLALGANQWASGDLVADNLRDFFDGEMPSFTLYDQALSAEDIAALTDKPLPLPAPDEATTNEDQAVTISVLANDSDPDGDTLSIVGVTAPANGTAVIDDNGTTGNTSDDTVIYTPDPDFSGTDAFDYSIQNSAGGSASATVTVSVNALPDAPVAKDDTYAVITGQTLTIDAGAGVLANDSDPDGDPLTAAVQSGPGKGSLTLEADGSFTYTPDSSTFDGQDGFTYTVEDSTGRTATATVTLETAAPDDVNFAPQIVTGVATFERQIVDTKMPRAHMNIPADFDGDGDIDLVGTSEAVDTVAWYENDGNFSFTKRPIDTILESAYPVSVADLDQDGDTDVLAAGYREDKYVWYENDGSGTFTRHDIDTRDGPHSIVAEDIDGDGDIDLVTASQDEYRIAWYENDGAQNFTERLIDTDARGAKTALPGDLDGDGDLDIVMTANYNDNIAWYENDGAQTFTKHVIDTTADGAYFALFADLDGDGNQDVVSASQRDNTIAWYRNDGTANFTKMIIDNNALGARSVFAADVDRDGDLDVLAGSVDDDTVAWHENDGNGSFTKRIVDVSVDGAYGVFAEDVDRDGQIDVLSAGRNDGSISIHRQIKAHAIQVQSGGTFAIDTNTLQALDNNDGPSELTFTVVTAPAAGELQLNGVTIPEGGTFTQNDIDENRITYLHTVPGTVTDTFFFTLADGGEGGLSPASGFFTIDIAATANTSPVATNDTTTTDEDTAVIVAVLANDTDADGDTLTVTSVSAATGGTTVLNTDGTITYTPDPDFNGSDSFSYDVADGNRGADTGTVSVTVNPVNDPPVATDDSATTDKDTAVTVAVLDNDSDVDGDALTVTSVGAAANGTAVLNADGTITYTPSDTFVEQDSFTYTISDGNGETATATVSIAGDTVPAPLLSEGPHVFDGTAGSTIIIPHDASYVIDQGTFEVAFTADAVSGRRALFSKDSSGFDTGGHITAYVENGDLVARLQSTSQTHQVLADNIVNPGQSYHAAVTFGPEGLKLYLDGILVDENAYTGGLQVNEEPLVLGANQWASGDLVADRLRDYFDGEIRVFGLYDEALSLSEIGSLAAGGSDALLV